MSAIFWINTSPGVYYSVCGSYMETVMHVVFVNLEKKIRIHISFWHLISLPPNDFSRRVLNADDGSDIESFLPRYSRHLTLNSSH